MEKKICKNGEGYCMCQPADVKQCPVKKTLPPMQDAVRIPMYERQ